MGLPGNKEKLTMAGRPLPQYGALHGQLHVGRQRENGINPPNLSTSGSSVNKGSWHTLVTGIWSRARTWGFTFLSRQDVKAAGWGNLMPSHLSRALLAGWGDHTEQGQSAPLAVMLAVQNCEM